MSDLHRRRLLSLLALSPAIFASTAAFSAAPEQITDANLPRTVPVKIQPINGFQLLDRSRTMFGALQFRGGIAISSTVKEFGGLSGIQIDDDGRGFIAISDKGNWFTGRISYDANGSPSGIDGLVIAPMLAQDGTPLASKNWFDTESLAFDGEAAYVGIERVHRIVRFDFGREGTAARAVPLNLPPAMRKLPNNRGIEALVRVPKGSLVPGELIAISERALDSAGNIRGWILSKLSARAPQVEEFSVLRRDEFDISDATMLPDGDLVLLERKFSWTKGGGIRMRRIPRDMIRPGALLDGPVLLDADLAYEIDNFEGIDTHIASDGALVITLISDDNFSFIQRTLLMQFTLLP